jgi:uncharacterized protein YbjQ (UPF0145 family)
MLFRCSILGAALAISGCGFLSDGELAQQVKAKAELDGITRDYTTLVAQVGTTNSPISVADKIDQIIRRVSGIEGLSEQQKSSASSMVAAMEATAGDLRANALLQLALDQTMLREQIAENAAAAMILAAGALPRTQADFSGPQDHVAQMQAGVEMQRKSIQTGIDSMQPRLEQMKQMRERSTQQLNSLEADMSQLRQRANDAGPVEGYTLVEEAAGVKSQAIPVKKAIAEAEVQLASLEPDIEMMLLKRMNIEATREATNRAETNTRSLKNAVQAAGAAGRERAQAMIGELQANLAEYEKREKNEIAPLFEQAISNFQKAQRGGRANRGAGMVISANAARTLGDLHAMRADEAMANANLFNSMASTGELGLGDGETWTTLATNAEEMHTTSIEAARTAYESALEKLGSSKNNKIARESVQTLISALDGNSIAPTSPMELKSSAPRRPRGTGRTRPGGAAGGGDMAALMGTKGFDSPKALADFINSLAKRPQTPALIRQMAAASWTTDPEIMASMDNPQATEQQLGMMASVKFRVESVSGSTAQLGLEELPAGMPPGMNITIPLVKRNGEWFMDMDAFAKQMETMMESMFDGMMESGPGGEPGGFGRGGGGGGGGRIR